MSLIEIAKILTSFCFARYVNDVSPINTRSIDLVSSASYTFGLGMVAGFKIRFAGIIYFFPSLSASLLTFQYVGRMPGMAYGVSIAFDFFEFFKFFALVCTF